MDEVKKSASALKSAFDGMRTSGPRPLLRLFEISAEEAGLKGDLAQLLLRHVGNKSSEVREEIHARLSEWDYEASPGWAKAPPNTNARRAEIYELLQLPEKLRAELEKNLPARTLDLEREVVITDHNDESWYTRDFLRGREFYWPKYKDYLREKKKFSEDTLAALNESSNRVLESLAPPHTTKPDPRRGLVVGHVQSGKTTNFTAVIAKAIDAGYRLIIVLAGTIDLLRLQTQRRLDMELVGVENLGIDLSDPEREYSEDEAFPAKFTSYGKRPRELGATNIKRLTTSTGDFRAIDASFQALAFDEVGGSEKAFMLSAIKRTNVRLIVIKKVTARLKKLIREIKQINDIRSDIPTLVIDDESDQASVDVSRPTADAIKKRSRTNACIVELLDLLPRAQYVGYTATPFANVLVDPADAADIYPRDFIISLPRPTGYMGVRDFHDLGALDGQTPNKNAFVRQFSDGGRESLKRAIDSFVVSGAIKLFRQDRKVAGDFKHHTMMVHESSLNEEQADLKTQILGLWRSAGYLSTGAGPQRLRAVLEEDFRPVWKSQASRLPFPADYEALKPFVGPALKLITYGDSPPVLVVNGDVGGVDPAFDTTDHVWKIILGGAKLSRGFTVEGLTVTYFRRRARSQDTLMQMGRWFGFRGGYRDLVRLYLERGGEDDYDLYDAFESMCRDEEAFRAQLSRYAKPANGGPRIRPIQVPAVVYNSFPGLMPTARNKMFNARLLQAPLSGEWLYPTNVSLVSSDVRDNWKRLSELLQDGLERREFGKKAFLLKKVDRKTFVHFLDSLRWGGDHAVRSAERHFFRENPHAAENWVIALPLLTTMSKHRLGGLPVSVHERSQRDGAFQVFTDPADIGTVNQEVERKGSALHGNGVLLVYPTHQRPKHTHDQPYVGIGLFHPPVPPDAMRVIFTVRDPAKRDEVVISTPRRSS